MSEEPPRPVSDDRDAWNTYWATQGMPWRAEPEIEEKRQRYLTERRAIRHDFERGIYPFGGVQLARADVEWLLATHESGGIRGPVDVSDVVQQMRDGLDMRGADLRGQDLSGLPLARMRGGITRREWLFVTGKQREAAAVHLEDTTLRGTHLEGANLRCAYLERAYLHEAHLEGSELVQAHLEGAVLFHAYLNGKVPHAERPDIQPRQSGGKGKYMALPPADLHLAFFDNATSLYNAVLGDHEQGGIRVADARWNEVNLARADWRQFEIIGDESVARQSHTANGEIKTGRRRLEEYQTAVRAYRQLAIALRDQGINENADRFAYRAQMLQRQVLRRQRQWFRYLGSLLLDLIAGYGYRPARAFLAYVAVLLVFAAAFLLNAQLAAPHLTWDEALVLSISSFHGRGFFTSGVSLSDTLARLAAGEAMIGLLIEITFIATFTQRFFAR